MNEENVVWIHNEIPYSLLKEGSSAILCNMDGIGGHYIKKYKPST
jgi:hypothetical protein